MKKIMVEVSDEVYGLLAVLTKGKHAEGSVQGVVKKLIDHAQQGVYRPGAWERRWLEQAFGDEWQIHLEPGDPYGRPGCEHCFQRPAFELNLKKRKEIGKKGS